VLDVGTAAGQFWKLIPEQMESFRVIGLDVRTLRSFPYGSFVTGSGLKMPFRDRSFDCVICNSVIEHVGDLEAQRSLANEIRRVSRSLYIVQVPAKHFPIEPHFLLPFVQYLPQHLKRSLHRSLYGFDPGDINLLDKKSLRELFPEARIETEKFFLLSKSYVVVGTDPDTG
jgi:ubiquinone/menaquinone biosynthesis C-methylase UbiE